MAVLSRSSPALSAASLRGRACRTPDGLHSSGRLDPVPKLAGRAAERAADRKLALHAPPPLLRVMDMSEALGDHLVRHWTSGASPPIPHWDRAPGACADPRTRYVPIGFTSGGCHEVVDARGQRPARSSCSWQPRPRSSRPARDVAAGGGCEVPVGE